jgi:hypothetical protein
VRVLKAAAWIGLVLSIVWLFNAPGFEPVLACIGSLITLGGLAFRDKNRKPQKTNVQNQTVSGGSTGIQAGGNVSTNSPPKRRDE